MALKKVFEDDMGVTFSYWRVLPQISLDLEEGTMVAQVVPWVTEDARRSNKRPGHVHEVLSMEDTRELEEAMRLKFSKEDLLKELKKGDLRQVFYAKLKTLKAFTGAEDVLETVEPAAS